MLTTIGLSRGIGEGNPLVALYIKEYGSFWGLLLIKGLAILLGCYLYEKKRLRTLKIILVIYIFIAIVPWVWSILLTK
ncbi:DUF5658 family protein [Candidatus Parcubacteria bacterium]|nr:DUF5658 family protein [Candidatus Parcubacteria bacterium]